MMKFHWLSFSLQCTEIISAAHCIVVSDINSTYSSISICVENAFVWFHCKNHT